MMATKLPKRSAPESPLADDQTNENVVDSTVSEIGESPAKEEQESISDAIGSAAKDAQANGDPATHAAMDSVHQAIYDLKTRIHNALNIVEGDAADLLTELKGIL